MASFRAVDGISQITEFRLTKFLAEISDHTADSIGRTLSVPNVFEQALMGNESAGSLGQPSHETESYRVTEVAAPTVERDYEPCGIDDWISIVSGRGNCRTFEVFEWIQCQLLAE